MITEPYITAADLAHVTAPVLVLAGEHDLIPAAHTREIATGFPHARLHLLPGAGHGGLLEVPNTFNVIVNEFFPLLPDVQ